MSGSVTAPVRRQESSLRFRILGPFEVIDEDGRAVDLGGPKQRAVLAILCINANRAVALDELIDQLWGDEAPARAAATIQAYISNLRRLVDPGRPPRAPSQVIVSQAPGYTLVVPPEQLDSASFVALVDDARTLAAEQPESARRLLSEALALWRGPALAGMPASPSPSEPPISRAPFIETAGQDTRERTLRSVFEERRFQVRAPQSSPLVMQRAF